MKFISMAAIAAATGVLALGGVAEAKDKDKDKRGHSRWEQSKHPHGMPPGQAKKMHRYSSGQHLPRTYYTNRTYYVVQPQTYNLRTAPPGYQWVRVGNDVYLTQTRTGLIADVIAGLLD